jgi:hypothetical protein
MKSFFRIIANTFAAFSLIPCGAFFFTAPFLFRILEWTRNDFALGLSLWMANAFFIVICFSYLLWDEQ